MTRKILLSAAALLFAATTTVSLALRAQQPQAGEKDPLTFDVGSVKPSAGCPPACGLIRPTVGNQGYHVEGSTLRTLMTVAYTVTDRQISGGPAWLGTDRFDIEAKATRPRTVDELHIMLQHLLEERFQLKVRHETRQESVWDLVVAKGGSKMPVHDAADKDYPPMGPQMVRDPDGSVCLGLPGRNVTMNYFAFVLSRSVDRAVIDKTNLPDRYDVALKFLPAALPPRGPEGGELTISPDCHDIAVALPQQLGLKLESAKGPVDFLVIERAEKPSEN